MSGVFSEEEMKDLQSLRAVLGESGLNPDYEAHLAAIRDSPLPAQQLRAKHALLDWLFTRLLSNCENVSEVSNLKALMREQDRLVESLFDLAERKAKETSGADEESWKQRCQKAEHDMGEIIEVSQRLQKEVWTLRTERNEAEARWDKERNELTGQIAALETENKKYLGTIVRQSQGNRRSQSPTKSRDLGSPSVILYQISTEDRSGTRPG